MRKCTPFSGSVNKCSPGVSVKSNGFAGLRSEIEMELLLYRLTFNFFWDKTDTTKKPAIVINFWCMMEHGINCDEGFCEKS